MHEDAGRARARQEAAMVSDRREPDDEIYEIFSDNEVILTWRPAKPADPKKDEEQNPGAA
jgi:hypothetical protein